MNRGPTVAQTLPVDRYAGNCLIKPSYYGCGGGGRAHNSNNVAPQEQPPRCRFADAGYHRGVAVGQTPYHHHHYQQRLQDWYGRTAYWPILHHHLQQNQGAGGPPLQHAEKANFAAHKHGAPLIQAAKYNNGGGGGGGRSASGTVAGCSGGAGAKKNAKKTLTGANGGGKKNAPADGGSDESSGGAASENSLPRIIKPRKRRKKERKPAAAAAAVQPLAAVIVVAAAAAASQERPPSSLSTSSSSSLASSPPPAPPPPPQRQQAREELQPRRAAFDTMRLLSADIKAVSLEDVASTCQCACCDPVGNVWDVGRRCFSPSLTRPEPARRSWSGESAPPPPPPSSEISTAAAAVAAPVVRARTHSLEVSSEIVTSHNGHRDIEIKFFTMPVGGR